MNYFDRSECITILKRLTTKGSTELVNPLNASVTTIALIVLWTILGFFDPLVELNENQTLYIFSAESQVIAAVFGLILTGYIFLRNQQDRLAERDESMTGLLKQVQKQQFEFMKFITILSLASIVTSLLAIAYREASLPIVRLGTLNAAAVLFFASLLWTGSFVIDALRPEDNIRRASRVIMADVEERGSLVTGRDGTNLEEFLKEFNAIAEKLEGFARDPLTFDDPTQRRNNRTPTKPRIVQAMLLKEVIPGGLAKELISLIQYRNAVVHGQDPTVSDSVLERIRVARSMLEKCLQAIEPQDPGANEDPEI